jgi:hypothetical protein
VSLLRAEIPDAGRFDPEYSTKQPLFTVSDWTREPVLQCKNDGRKRVPLVTAETCQTEAIKVQMVIYPPGTKSANNRLEGGVVHLSPERPWDGRDARSKLFGGQRRSDLVS